MKKLLILAILSLSIMIFVNGCATFQDSRTNHSTAISSEWEMIEFEDSSEFIAKEREAGECYAKDKDNAQCDKILDSWRESCARGEEKYCIGVFTICRHQYKCGVLRKSLVVLEENCDNGMAGSCHAMGEFYNMFWENAMIYAKSPSAIKETPDKVIEKILLYLHKSCDLGMAMGCASIAVIYSPKLGYLQGTMEQVKTYADKALAIADKDCKAGVKMACDVKEEIYVMFEIKADKVE